MVAETRRLGAYAELRMMSDEHPAGELLEFESLTLGTAMNAGWHWNVNLTKPLDDLEFPRQREFRIHMVDGMGGELHSPYLVALPRDDVDEKSEQPPEADLSGVDLTTHKMSRDNYSTATFRSTDSKVILEHLAGVAGVTIIGSPDFPVPDEDVKQSKLLDAMNRMLAVAGCEWLVDEFGQIRVYGWDEVGGKLDVDWSTIRRNVDPEKRFTSMKIGKRSAVLGNGQQGNFEFPFREIGFKSFALPNPISNAFPRDASSIGFVDWVGFFDGDPTANGRLIAFFATREAPPALQNAFAGRWPATHVSCVVFPPAGLGGLLPGIGPSDVVCLLKIIGSPATALPSGIEAEFLYAYEPSDDDPLDDEPWPAPDWIDSLFPNKAYAVAKAPTYLAMKNKGWCTLQMDAVAHLFAALRQKFTYRTKDYKVNEIAWTYANGQAPTSTIGLVRR